MEPRSEEYKGHRIELRAPSVDKSRDGDAELLAQQAKPELLIDDAPVSYGQLPDGRYFLNEYAYDWRDDLTDLARSFIDYRSAADARRETGEEE